MTIGRNAVRVVPVFLALVALAVLGFLGMNLHAQAQTKLEVRLAEERPATGLVDAPVSHSDKHVYLHPSAVITNEDVSTARVVPAGGAAFNVAISFTPQGTERMMSATQTHIGRPVAILVNGTVVAAPTLRGSIGQDAIVSGDWTREQADEIAAGLSGR
jgi:preprotein translocase subunit SecD